MNKKQYLKPAMMELTIATTKMVAISGRGTGGIKVSNTADYSDEVNRSRRSGDWDDDEYDE